MAAAIVATAVLLSGCAEGGNSGDSREAGDAPAQPQPERKREPSRGSLATIAACAEDLGYRIEKRDSNLIAIWPAQGQFALVEKMPSHAEAKRAAEQADLVVSTVVGRLWAKYGGPGVVDDGLKADVDTCLLTKG